VNDFLDSAYDFLKIDYPKFYKMDRLSKLGFLAAEFLLRDQALRGSQPEDRNIVLANANASLDTDIKFAQTFSSPAVFVYTLPNIVAGEICIRHGIKGESAFFISEQFDAELVASYVSSVMLKVLAPGAVQCCIGGWIDLLGERHDVFLYLVEETPSGMEHSAEQLLHLYHD
jgi:hypothetical protein